MNKLFFAATIMATLAFAPQIVRAQNAAMLASKTQIAIDFGKPVPSARDVALPVSVKRRLPRGATTLFCVQASLEGRALLLHGWNPVKGETKLDIFTAPASATRKTQNKRRARVLSRSTATLKRISLGRIEPNWVVVRAAPLQKGARGSVITLQWAEPQAAGAFSSVPMLAVTLPGGLTGKAVFQELETESSSGGNVFYALHKDKAGSAFLVLTNQSFDAGTQTLQRFGWNGRKFQAQGEIATVPLPSK